MISDISDIGDIMENKLIVKGSRHYEQPSKRRGIKRRL